MRKLFAILALVASCGGSDGPPIGPAGGTGGTTVVPPPASALIGGWGAEVAGSPCVLLLGFKEDGTYINGTVCVESSGRNDFDEEKGTFIEDAANGRIHFMATDATCAGVVKAYHYDYAAVRGKSLTITASDAVVVLTPLDSWSGSGAPSMGGVLTLGCLNMGAFTPGPLMPVP